VRTPSINNVKDKKNNQFSVTGNQFTVILRPAFGYWHLIIGDYLELGIWLLGFS
jgi:hypothetical protein